MTRTPAAGPEAKRDEGAERIRDPRLGDADPFQGNADVVVMVRVEGREEERRVPEGEVGGREDDEVEGGLLEDAIRVGRELRSDRRLGCRCRVVLPPVPQDEGFAQAARQANDEASDADEEGHSERPPGVNEDPFDDVEEDVEGFAQPSSDRGEDSGEAFTDDPWAKSHLTPSGPKGGATTAPARAKRMIPATRMTVAKVKWSQPGPS